MFVLAFSVTLFVAGRELDAFMLHLSFASVNAIPNHAAKRTGVSARRSTASRNWRSAFMAGCDMKGPHMRAVAGPAELLRPDHVEAVQSALARRPP